MRSHRFYTAIDLTIDASIELPPEAAHHCIQVLRYKVGDPLTLFNGDGFDYSATISEINKKQCTVKIAQKNDPKNESPLKIHLLQGIARGDKMDFIIQKAIELGVTEITPVFTQRSNVKLDEKKLEKKQLHWNKTIISACEQSGRAVIPKLNAAISLDEIKKSECVSIYLEPQATKFFSSLELADQISVVIGPEGGFSHDDLSQLNRVGFKGVKIGPRILRTETAGLSAISILQSHFGDLK